MIYDLIYNELIKIFNINATTWANEMVATVSFILTLILLLIFLSLPLKLVNYTIFDLLSPSISDGTKRKRGFFD